LVVIAAALTILGGGKTSPPRSATLESPAPSESGISGTHNAAAPAIARGQSILSLWPVGGTTTWVFTSNLASPTNAGQRVEWTSDGGRTWRDATPSGYSISGGRHSLGDFFAVSAKRAWLVARSTALSHLSSPRLLTTDDGGRTWSVAGTVPSSPCTLIFSSVEFGICDSSNGAGGAAPLALYATHNGGRTWSHTFDNTGGFGGTSSGDKGLPYPCDKEFSMTAGNVVWAKFWCLASVASLYRSADAGHTWSEVNLTQPSPVLPGGAEFTGPVVLRGQRGAVAFTEGTSSLVYVTRDGGQSFTPVYPPGPVHPWAVDIVSPTVWHIAYRNQILSTNDAGVSWTGLSDDAFSSATIRRSQRYGSGSPATLNFTTSSFGWMSWFAGNGYIVMSTRDGGQTWHEVAVPGTGSRRS
jgi:photosystem II stability/assembly factor-like uncharacterized protein